jgi:RNA polymerase sigma-70 factor (ECF subfamily)
VPYEPSLPAAVDQPAGTLARCQAGDQAAWAEMVDRYSGYVYAIAVRGYGLDHASAEDVFQEVFARTFEHIDQLRDDEAVRPWVGQLARRLCIDRLRATARVEPHEDPPDVGAEDPVLERIEEAMTVYESLALLPEDQRTVLARFFLNDESYETIGDALELPPGTIASRISRGLTALRQQLEGSAVG